MFAQEIVSAIIMENVCCIHHTRQEAEPLFKDNLDFISSVRKTSPFLLFLFPFSPKQLQSLGTESQLSQRANLKQLLNTAFQHPLVLIRGGDLLQKYII